MRPRQGLLAVGTDGAEHGSYGVANGTVILVPPQMAPTISPSTCGQVWIVDSNVGKGSGVNHC